MKIPRKGEWIQPARLWLVAGPERYQKLVRYAKDQWGRRLVVVKIPFVGLIAWAYRICRCGHCTDRRHHTIQKLL